MIAFGYWGNGLSRELIFGVAILAALLAWIYSEKYTTYVEIEGNRFLVNKGQRDFSHDRLDIFSIKYIARANQFKIKSGGNQAMFYAESNDGVYLATKIGENQYSEANLKAFLNKIKHLNPNIQLDKQYQMLVDGKLPAYPTFRRIPAEHSPDEVHSLMKEKFGTKL